MHPPAIRLRCCAKDELLSLWMEPLREGPSSGVALPDLGTCSGSAYITCKQHITCSERVQHPAHLQIAKVLYHCHQHWRYRSCAEITFRLKPVPTGNSAPFRLSMAWIADWELLYLT